MNIKALETLIREYETATDLDFKMRLANQMIDIIKKEIWALVGQIREIRG